MTLISLPTIHAIDRLGASLLATFLRPQPGLDPSQALLALPY